MNLRQLHLVLVSRGWTIAMAALSALLLCASLFGMHGGPMYSLDAFVTLSFCAEIAARYALQPPGAFWSSALNFAEAALCAFCLVTFLSMSVAARAVHEEHAAVASLRLLGQGVRFATLCHKQSYTEEAAPLPVLPGAAAV